MVSSILNTPSHPLFLRALSRLIEYPKDSLIEQMGVIRAAIQKTHLISEDDKKGLMRLCDWLSHTDLWDLQAYYVECFDCGKTASLHLFEHIHGDSRQRGQAMVDLHETYQQGGYVATTNELPDHLTLILEFASVLEKNRARQFLAEMFQVLNRLYSVLKRRNSLYAEIVKTVIHFSGEKITPQANDLSSQITLDQDWEEPPVFQGCSLDGQ